MINDLDIVQWEYLLSPEFELINSAGKPLTGGWIEVYLHGTRDKYYCALDFSGTLHPFKIPLDSIGANVVLADPNNAYDVYVYNKFGSLIMSRYNVKCHGGGSGSSTYVGDRLYYGQFKATDVATQAGLTRVTGNIDVDNGKLELKQGMSYHITLRGEFVVNEVSNVDTVLSYIEYSAVKPINVNVDYTKPDSQYFEISYDIYRLAEDMDYPVSFLQSNGLVKNLVVEVHSLSNLATSTSGEGSEYEPGWGIVIQNNVISVDPSILEDYATHEEVIAAVSGITGIGPGEVYNAGDYISIEDNTISVTGINPDEYATHDEVYNATVTAVNLVTGMIPTEQVQSDWDQEDENEPDYIKNKPHIPSIELDSGDQVTAIDGHTLAGTGGSEYNEGFGIDITNGEISIDTNIVALASAIPPAQVQADWDQADDTQVDYIKNKPDLSVYATHDELNTVSGILHEEINNIDLSDYSTHTEVYNATVTAVQIATGAIPEIPEEEEVEFEEINLDDYALASAIPDVSDFASHTEVYEATVTAIDYVTGIIPEAQVQSDWNQNDSSKPDYIKNKPSIPSVEGLATVEQVSAVSGYLQNEINNIPSQVQSDWDQSDNTQVDFIKNKPTEYDLVAGHNVSISVSGTNVVISSTGGSGGGSTYTEGLGIDITNDVISLDNPVQLIAGDNVSISVSGVSAVISAQGGGSTYTEGLGIDITNNEIAIDPNVVALASTVPAIELNDDSQVTGIDGHALAASGPSYTSGTGIDISNDVISVDNTVAMKTDIPELPEEEEVEFEELNLDDYALASAVPTVQLDNNNQVTAIDGHALAGGSSADSDTFTAEVYATSQPWGYSVNTSLSTSYADVKAAYDAGKKLMVKFSVYNGTAYEFRTLLNLSAVANNATTFEFYDRTSGTDIVSIEYSVDYIGAELYGAQADWNASLNGQAGYIKNKPSIPEIELNSDSQVTAIDGHVLAGGGGDSYTEGFGIDISNNEISIDPSIVALASADPNIFFVHVKATDTSFSSTTEYTPYAEVKAAYDAGKILYCVLHTPLNWIFAVLPLASASNMNAQSSGYLSLIFTAYSPEIYKSIYVVTYDGMMQTVYLRSYPSQADWNQQFSNYPGYIKNKPSIPEIELNSDSQVTAIDGHTLAGGGGGGSTYTAGDYISIQNDVIAVTGINPSLYAAQSDLEAVSGLITPELPVVAGEGIGITETETEITIAVTGNYVSDSDLQTAIQTVEAEIPVVTGYATKTELQAVSATIPELPDEEEVEFEDVDLTDYALASAIPDTSDMATQTWVGNQGFLTSVPSNYVTETELTGAVSGFATKGELATVEAEIPVVTGFATKTELNGKQNTLTGITDVQVVNSLPGSPVATVLYLIPEV